MRRFLLILSACVLWFTIAAQDFDLQTLSSTDIIGTARYIGLAGAMTAVGGDESAVKDNPAALGIFRRSVASASLLCQNERTLSSEENCNKTIARMPHAALVWSFGYDNRYRGMIYNNIMIGYQRIKSFSERSVYSSASTTSLAQQVADITNLNPYKGSITSQMLNGMIYDDENIGWLTALFVKEGIITDNMGTWTAADGYQDHSVIEIVESGGVNAYGFTWATNISNKVYIGVGANLMSLTYGKSTIYYEHLKNLYGDDLAYTLESTLSVNGLGFMGNIGVIYWPLSFLRIGASWISPSIYSMTFINHAKTRWNETPVNSYNFSNYFTPMRSTAGIAFRWGNHGLITGEYDYSHQFRNTIADTHTIKAGLEFVGWNKLFVRLGYAYEFCWQRGTLMPQYYETRTDTDFRRNRRSHYATASVGYRGRYMYVEAAYRFRLTNADLLAYASQSEAYRVDNRNHAVVLSLGWHN